MKLDWMKTFIEEQELYAQHATCADIYVSALVIDHSVPQSISHGYNGTPSGMVECEELDELIIKFSKEFSREQLWKMVIGDKKISSECKAALPSWFGRYKDDHAEWVVAEELKVLSRMNPADYEKLPEDVQTRLKHNYVHYAWEIHGEANALGKCHVDLSDPKYALMVNYSPCFECAKNIIARGLKRVYYRNEWIDIFWGRSSLDFLRAHGIEVVQY